MEPAFRVPSYLARSAAAIFSAAMYSQISSRSISASGGSGSRSCTGVLSAGFAFLAQPFKNLFARNELHFAAFDVVVAAVQCVADLGPGHRHRSQPHPEPARRRAARSAQATRSASFQSQARMHFHNLNSLSFQPKGIAAPVTLSSRMGF